MAGKRKFSFWEDHYNTLMMLPTDEQRGRLVMAMGAWAFDGTEPDFGDDLALKFAFSMVAGQITESVNLYQQASEAGKASGRSRRKSKTNGVRTDDERRSNGVHESFEQNANGVPNGVPNVSKYVSNVLTDGRRVLTDTPPSVVVDERYPSLDEVP